MSIYEQLVNGTIRLAKARGDIDTNNISDTFHTFGELYDHRIELYIALCRALCEGEDYDGRIWRSTVHSDGTSWDGWFLLGIHFGQGYQITYHLPIARWDDCRFAVTKERAPEFDGHTSADVLERLKKL